MSSVFLTKSVLDGIFEVQKDKRLVKAWASVEVIDRDGELISIDALKKAMPILMDRGGNVMFEHSNKPVGKIISYEFTTHPETGEEGLLLLIKVFDHYDFDNDVWEMIKKGEITGISIGGVAKEYEIVEKNGRTVKKYTDIETLEFSFVRKPANPYATIETVNVLAKGVLINNNKEYNCKTGEVVMDAKEIYKSLKEVAEIEREKVELAKTIKEDVIKTISKVKNEVKEEVVKMKDELKEDVIKTVEDKLSKVDDVVKSLNELIDKLVETIEKSDKIPSEEEVNEDKEKECKDKNKQKDKKEDKKEDESVEKSSETPLPSAKSSEDEEVKKGDNIDLSVLF